MGEVDVGGRPVESMTDEEIGAWVEGQNDGYRLREDTRSFWIAALRVFDDVGPPMTVRQMFYRLVSVGAIEKHEKAYSKVARQILKMRRRDIIPYGFIADGTRWMRKPKTYDSVDEMLRAASSSYRRALWTNQPYYCEVWVEKDALAGVFNEITSEYDVPLMVTRGFSSESFLFEASEKIKDEVERGKTCVIFYFGDYDPSGVSISEHVERRLREFGARVLFSREAITRTQIVDIHLETRPTKTSDSRSINFEGESVELDAIHPNELRGMVLGAIRSVLDSDKAAVLEEVERLERDSLLTAIAKGYFSRRPTIVD